MIVLGTPIIIAQLAQSAMALVDVYLVAPLGPQAIGAAGLGANVFFGLAFTIASVLLCLDTLVSQSIGRGDRPYAARVFMQALALGLALIPISCLAMAAVVWKLDALGVDASVAPLAKQFILATIPGVPALIFAFAATKFLQAHNRSLPVMLIAIAANVANYFLDMGLIYGNYGFPQLGVVGAGIATTSSRWFMAIAFAVVLVRARYPFKVKDFGIDWQLWKQMLLLGVPAAGQVALEIGMFVLAGFMIARFEADLLAAHYILLQLASLTFMVPLGVSSAASVRVGHAIGAGMPREAVLRGQIAILFSAVVMAGSAAALLLFGRQLANAFGARAGVTEAFLTLVTAAAAFQVFDGIQVTTTGALRGLGDTRSTFFVNVAGHWLIAFPIALLFGFYLDWRAQGVWIGLMAGLTSVAIMLMFVWQWRVRRLLREAA